MSAKFSNLVKKTNYKNYSQILKKNVFVLKKKFQLRKHFHFKPKLIMPLN